MPARLSRSATKRGDTIIEVMFAIAVFSLVAVLSVMSMDSSISSAENALETVTVRNELNAQAEALRFVHSSYISERTLPLRSEISDAQYNNGEKYQQYEQLWSTIINNAISTEQAKESGLLDLADTINNSDTGGALHAIGCERVYEATDSGTLLSRNNAFVLNTRDLSSRDANGHTDVGVSYVSARTDSALFVPAELSARIIYQADILGEDGDSVGQFTDGGIIYNRIKAVEGIWVIAVHDENDQYYDFYIESCWYGPDTTSPAAIDTVIRLYNPENIK